MKNLTNALQKGNLTAKERVILLVHNAVKEEREGKGILAEAEKHALSDGWQPTNNEQVREYNRYMKAWRTVGFAELDAQTTFLETQSFYNQEKQATSHLLLYPFFRNAKEWFERLDTILPVNVKRALEIIEKQKQVKLESGMDFDYAVYQLAYELTDKQTQEDLKTLYEEVAYDHQYLDQEEALYNLLNGKDSLTTADKEKLATMIVRAGYNSFAKKWQFWHYYASIPLKEIGKRWLDKRGIKPTEPTGEREKTTLDRARKRVEEVRGEQITPEEALKEYTAENLETTITEYATAHNTTVDDELKAVVLEWIDEGLLTDYEPIYKSTSTQTHNGKTKQPHNEVFTKWLEAKTKAKATLEGLVKEGKLAREGDTITGESLYTFTGDYDFIKKHKEYIDRYDANLGIVYEDDDPEHKGRHIDRELLICDTDEAGKVRPLSMFDMAKSNLEGYFDVMGLVTETEEKGERVISFKEDVFNEIVRNTTELLRNNYAILLAFKAIFDRATKTYRIDLSYKINRWIGEAEGFIDSHNQALQTATERRFYEIQSKKKVRIKEDWYIDKEKIQAQPSHERVKGYFKEFEDTLGSDF